LPIKLKTINLIIKLDKMKIYNVIFSYNIKVEAENEEFAEDKAMEEYREIMPRLEEMNINVETK